MSPPNGRSIRLMHLTTYCCCIRTKVWTKCSLWAGEGPAVSTTRDQPFIGPTGADSQQNILRKVERAGLLALYVE